MATDMNSVQAQEEECNDDRDAVDSHTAITHPLALCNQEYVLEVEGVREKRLAEIQLGREEYKSRMHSLMQEISRIEEGIEILDKEIVSVNEACDVLVRACINAARRIQDAVDAALDSNIPLTHYFTAPKQ